MGENPPAPSGLTHTSTEHLRKRRLPSRENRTTRVPFTRPPISSMRLNIAADPLGRENCAFAQSENFLLREDRTFLKCVFTPQQGDTK